MKCPRCGANLPAGAASCGNCGAKFQTGKRCPNCQNLIPANAAACPKCGAKFGGQAAASPGQNPPKARGSFRWWRIPIYIVVFLIGIGVGAAFSQFPSSNNSSNTQSASAPPVKTEDVSSQEQSSEEPVSSEPEETPAASDYYFVDNVLVSEDVRIEITDWKVIPAGETGNEYGDSPVIAFWYSTTNLSGNESVSPMTSWITMFTAVQDNDANLVNELSVAALPDHAFLETQMAVIKKDGTVDCAVAYTLDDTTTPVTLKATRGLLGEDLGEQTFQIAE